MGTCPPAPWGDFIAGCPWSHSSTVFPWCLHPCGQHCTGCARSHLSLAISIPHFTRCIFSLFLLALWRLISIFSTVFDSNKLMHLP